MDDETISRDDVIFQIFERKEPMRFSKSNVSILPKPKPFPLSQETKTRPSSNPPLHHRLESQAQDGTMCRQ